MGHHALPEGPALGHGCGEGPALGHGRGEGPALAQDQGLTWRDLEYSQGKRHKVPVLYEIFK